MNKVYHLVNDFELNLDESSYITFYIESDNIKLNYNLRDGIYHVLIFNSNENNTSFKEQGLIENASVNITIIDLNNTNYVQNSLFDVKKNGKLYINSIYLASNNKKIDFNLSNLENNSEIFINNNAVCLNDSNFELTVIGNVKRGAKYSKCNQKSQCLTFESPKKAKVLPVLNIDENDVEASHSLSSGTIDEEVLFYINSRGINKKEALKLILLSYLIPDDDYFNLFIEGDLIRKEAEMKVNKACSM